SSCGNAPASGSARRCCCGRIRQNCISSKAMTMAAASSCDPRGFLASLFDTAVRAADPRDGIRRHLPAPPQGGRTVVIGAGKGAAQMAAALEALWEGPLSGLVVSRYGYGCPTRTIEVVEAAHPVPDMAGMLAAARLKQTMADLT